jgi:hypothetical protein
LWGWFLAEILVLEVVPLSGLVRSEMGHVEEGVGRLLG